MTEITGLIEIESDGFDSGSRAVSCDDATLDDLFTRLVGRPAMPSINRGGCGHGSTLLLTANLDMLAAGLADATRELLAEIFLSLGRR